MNADHNDSQPSEPSRFVNDVLNNIKHYEVRKKRQQTFALSTALLFVGFLLLIHPGYLFKNPQKSIIDKHPLNAPSLSPLFPSSRTIEQFGYNVGKPPMINPPKGQLKHNKIPSNG